LTVDKGTVEEEKERRRKAPASLRISCPFSY
jgi:hypothetical protein